ncbi:MAG: HD domain-containing phosphohydrolase, partial [Myxococcaceae bacterium]
MKLSKTILLLMLVASIVPTVMVGLLGVSDTRELLVRDAQELAQERVKQIRLKTESLVARPTQTAWVLARVPNFFELPLDAQRSHVAAVMNQRREVTAITVFSADKKRVPGLQAFAVKDVPPTEVAEHEATARALLEGLHDVAYSQVTAGHPSLTVAFPLGDPPKGYVAAQLALDNMTEMLSLEKVGSSGFAYVVDRAGKLVAGVPALGPHARAGVSVAQRPAVAHLLEQLKTSPDSEAFHVGNFGSGDDRVVGAYAMMPQLGWAIVSEQPIELAYAQVATMQQRMAVGGFIATLVALGLAAMFSRRVTRPLKSLTQASTDIAKGQFGTQVKIKEKNELGELAQTFNYMSMQIQAYDGETRRLYESLEKGYLETIVALANSIDSKDAYTRGHSQRVGDTSVEIGREMNLTEREIKLLHYGGILHDVGKIGIIESILLKQTRLTDEEMVVMREHPSIGDSIIEPVTFLHSVRAAVRNHHERWDGTGYPDKLK